MNRIHKEEGLLEYKCGNCKASFFERRGLMNHIAAVHEGQKAYKCEICDKRFIHKIGLSNHFSRIHEGLLEYKRGTYEAGFLFLHGSF